MRAGAGMVEICQGLDGTRAELAARNPDKLVLR